MQRYALWTPAPPQGSQFHIALFLRAQVSATSLAAIYEDFKAVNTVARIDGAADPFAPVIVTETPNACVPISGCPLRAERALDDTLYDAVVIPALYDDGCLSDPGYGPILSPHERAWLQQQHAAGALLSTMCTGAFVMAEAGLLEGHTAGVYDIYADTFRARYPNVQVETHKTLIVSGARHELISGGHSSYSADISLYNILRFVGPDMALRFAGLYGREWTEALHAAGGAVPSNHTGEGADRVISLAKQFMVTHLADPGLIGSAAALVNMTPRTFARRFRRATGQTPQDYLIAIRIDCARDLLARSRIPVDEIANKVGYADRASFAKIFRTRTGIPPGAFRLRVQRAAALTI